MAKTQTVADVMTTDPVTLDAGVPIQEAARSMRDADIGDILVTRDDDVFGIVTDRDIVVRAVAENKDPATTTLADVCSDELTALSPDSNVADAVQLMRDNAVRRLPVVQGGRPVGIVSLGDLAIDRDSGSALADISEAPPNT